jgi:hypothetical protein
LFCCVVLSALCPSTAHMTQELTIRRFSSAEVPEAARCLDGSLGAYYRRRSTSTGSTKKGVLIFFGAGSICTTVDQCATRAADRSANSLGSSVGWNDAISTHDLGPLHETDGFLAHYDKIYLRVRTSHSGLGFVHHLWYNRHVTVICLLEQLPIPQARFFSAAIP